MSRLIASLVATCLMPSLHAAALPPAFELNIGQSPSAMKFLSRGTHYVLFATDRDIVLSLASSPAHPVRMRLPCRIRPEGIDPLDGKTNYLGSDPLLRNVPNYARIRYPSVAPGIDLVLRHGNA